METDSVYCSHVLHRLISPIVVRNVVVKLYPIALTIYTKAMRYELVQID